MPMPIRTRWPNSSTKAWCRSAVSDASCIHRLRMPVATVIVEVARSTASTTSKRSPPMSGSQMAVYPRCSTSAAASSAWPRSPYRMPLLQIPVPVSGVVISRMPSLGLVAVVTSRSRSSAPHPRRARPPRPLPRPTTRHRRRRTRPSSSALRSSARPSSLALRSSGPRWSGRPSWTRRRYGRRRPSGSA